MAKGGRKYRLLLYRVILDRWWPMMLTLSIIIFLNVGALWAAQWYFIDPTENPLPVLSDNNGYIMIGVGCFSLLLTFFLLLVRGGAYVQLFDTHIRLATPFLRTNISYKRIHRTTTAQVATLFPPSKHKGSAREVIEPLATETALVIYLKSYPLPRVALRLFLSPFFFFDKTPHFVLIVDDWMSLSIELDSRRSGGSPKPPRRPSRPRIASGLLDDLTRK